MVWRAVADVAVGVRVGSQAAGVRAEESHHPRAVPALAFADQARQRVEIPAGVAEEDGIWPPVMLPKLS